MWGKCEAAKEDVNREQTLSFVRICLCVCLIVKANIRPRKLEPVKAKKSLSEAVFVKVTAGAYHNAAIDKNGFVYTWGDCSSGCLGHEKLSDRPNPTPIISLLQKKVKIRISSD